jgi:protein-tyrosine-phosphatase
MTQILFVCTANRYRSVIAEACFKDELSRKKQGGNDWIVLSAGTWTTNGMAPMKEAVQLARELGLDVQNHRSTAITGEMLQQADLVLVMESGQKEALQVEFPAYRRKIYLLSEAARGMSYDIPDPMSGTAGIDVVLEICELIRTGFDRICILARQ